MNVFDLFARISLDSSEYESGLSKALGFAKNAGAAIGAAVGAASAAVTAFAGESVKVGANFDSSMSQVAATMGYSVDDLNTAGSEAAETFGQLRDFAQQMGSSTAFSASEAADALNYMALAGYDAETSMQMLPNVLNLAAAGGIELAYASDMVTDAQSALGLSLDETSELVDKMAKASSKSNTSVAQLGEAILTIGATARSVKGGTTELATVLGVLADNGIKGSEGGTHLRNIIMSLQTPTKDGIAAFEQLGMTYDDMYDSAGNMRAIPDIIQEIAQKTEGMTQASRDAIVQGIFNKYDIAAVNALLNTNGERWDSLAESIDDATGAAEAMAQTQLDNLAGDITIFKSALEGAQIAVSDGLTPTLRKFVQFGSTGIQDLTTAFKEGGLTGAMEAFGTTLADGISMITDMLPQMVEAGMKLLSALGQGIMQNLPALATAATDVVVMLAQYIVESFPGLISAALQIVTTIGDGIVQALPQLIPAVVDVIFKIADTLTDSGNLGALIDAAIAIILALADGLLDALPRLIEKAPEIVQRLVTAIVDNAPRLFVAAGELIGKLVRGIVESVPQVAVAAGRIIETLLETLADLPRMAFEWGADLIVGFVNGVLSRVQNLKNTISDIAQSVKDFLGFSEPKEGPLSNFHTYAPDMMELFAKGIRDNEHLITDQISRSFDIGEFATASPAAGSVSTGLGSAEEKILALLSLYLPQMAQPVLTLDSGALIGGTARGYDTALGQIQARKVREGFGYSSAG